MATSGSESFSRRLRLIRSREFQRVFQKNKRYGDAYLTLLVGETSTGIPRLGFAIAKKQVARACRRNAIKRLVRESFRRQQHKLPARDIVFLARRDIVKLDNAALTALLEKHWTRIINHAKHPDSSHPSVSVSDQSTPA